MKVILLQNVPQVGSKDEIADVSEGYARNYLFPRRLATAATPEMIAEYEKKQSQKAKEEERELTHMQELASQLDGLEIEVSAKASEKGELYKGVSAKMIVDILSAMGHKVDAKDITLDGVIKHVGEHAVPVSLKHGLEAELQVIVIPEEAADTEDDD